MHHQTYFCVPCVHRYAKYVECDKYVRWVWRCMVKNTSFHMEDPRMSICC